MSKRVHLSESLKRKLKSKSIEKEKLLPQIRALFNKDYFANDSSLSTTPMKSAPAETTEIIFS